jgi:hypothetical protein
MSTKKETEELLAKTQQLFEWLKGGEQPKSLLSLKRDQPKLSKRQAWHLIWFLQEFTGVIPDHFELCHGCGEVFDSYTEGCTGRARGSTTVKLASVTVFPKITTIA